jgi:hypothetical protein
MIMSIEKLCEDVLDVIEMARGRVFRAVNVAVVRSYWEIGRLMVEGSRMAMTERLMASKWLNYYPYVYSQFMAKGIIKPTCGI